MLILLIDRVHYLMEFIKNYQYLLEKNHLSKQSIFIQLILFIGIQKIQIMNV